MRVILCPVGRLERHLGVGLGAIQAMTMALADTPFVELAGGLKVAVVQVGTRAATHPSSQSGWPTSPPGYTALYSRRS